MKNAAGGCIIGCARFPDQRRKNVTGHKARACRAVRERDAGLQVIDAKALPGTNAANSRIYRASLKCRCDGIGRRSGLKIRRWQHHAGSSPATGTMGMFIACDEHARFFCFFRPFWGREKFFLAFFSFLLHMLLQFLGRGGLRVRGSFFEGE